MRFIWEVRARGGAPEEVARAIADAVTHLREGAWAEDTIAAGVVNVASLDGTHSILVEVDMHGDDPAAAAALSAGFDEDVLDAALAVPGVLEVTHSDRIPRADDRPDGAR